MEDVLTLADMMLSTERVCSSLEARCRGVLEKTEQEDLRLKISQCRGGLERLQIMYNDDELRIANAAVRSNVRFVVITLLWISFLARHIVDRKLFRMIVVIESSYTYLLNTMPAENSTGES